MLKNQPSRARVTALPGCTKDGTPFFESRAHAHKEFFVFGRPQHPNKKSVKHRASREQCEVYFSIAEAKPMLRRRSRRNSCKPRAMLSLLKHCRGAADVARTKWAKQ